MSAVSSQMKDLMMLVESKSQKSYSSPRVLLEGKLNESYIRLAEDIHSDLVKFDKLLVEFQVSQEQVDDIFKRVAQGAKDGYNTDSGEADTSSNRTMFGKIADVGKKAYSVWDKLKTAIAQSAVVKAFDAKYHEVVQKLSKTKAGQMVSGVLDIYRDFAKKHPVMQEFILLVVAILANMAMGGTVPGPAITGVLRFADRLLLGDRLSSATWKGVKAAGLQMLLMKAVDLYKNPEQVTNWVKSVFPDDVSSATGAATQAGTAGQAAGAAGQAGAAASGAAQQITVPAKTDLSSIAQQFKVSVDQLLQANPQIANPDFIKAGETLNIPAAIGQQIYQGGVGTAADTAAKVASGTYKPFGVRESIDYKRIKERWEIQKELNLPQTSALYLTNEGVDRVFRKIEKYAESTVNEGFFDNLTNKITYSHLDNWWKRNYGDNVTKGSVESKELVAFLTKMGVKAPLISKVFGELKLPTDDVVSPDNMTMPQDQAQQQAQQTTGPKDRTEPTMPDDTALDNKKDAGGVVDGGGAGDKTTAPTPQPTKYKTALTALQQISASKDKGRLKAWIEKNWGAATTPKKPEATGPKPRTGRKTATPAPKKTAKPFPTRRDSSGKPDTVTPGTVYERRQVTKESRERPPWLGKR